MIQALLAAAPAIMEALPALTGAAEAGTAAAGAEGAAAAGGSGGIGGMMKNLAGGQFGNLLGGGGGGGGNDSGGGIGGPLGAMNIQKTIGGVMDTIPGVAAAGFNAMLK